MTPVTAHRLPPESVTRFAKLAKGRYDKEFAPAMQFMTRGIKEAILAGIVVDFARGWENNEAICSATVCDILEASILLVLGQDK